MHLFGVLTCMSRYENCLGTRTAVAYAPIFCPDRQGIKVSENNQTVSCVCVFIKIKGFQNHFVMNTNCLHYSTIFEGLPNLHLNKTGQIKQDYIDRRP